MEQKILTPQLSDLRQRRQKAVDSDLKSTASDAGDSCEDADTSSKSLTAASATKSLWFHRARLCISVVVMLMCAWAYASYVKQLHEIHLWFSNIQVRQL